MRLDRYVVVTARRLRDQRDYDRAVIRILQVDKRQASAQVLQPGGRKMIAQPKPEGRKIIA
jgi:hypothetical protein